MTWSVCSYTVADTSNENPGANDPGQSALRALENLSELEPGLKAAAVVDNEGRTVASTGTAAGAGSAWSGAALELLASVDEAGESDFDSAHLATDEAEIFVVREGELALIAVTERFVLASLTSFDMRMALRDLNSGAANA